MTIGLLGENLIFLISQPRAGSTLLQKILGAHRDIFTTGEPWIMLPPVYTMRETGHTAEYDVAEYHFALKGVMEGLPSGREDYLEGIRRMYTHLYNCLGDSSGKPYFLDKTPRYYYIIPELHQIFPRAQYIFLYRNPIATQMSRIGRAVTDGRWLYYLAYSRGDWLLAPRLITEGQKLLGDRAVGLNYEQLLTHPKVIVRRVCEQLNIEFAPDMLHYGREDNPQWAMGDKTKIYEYDRPDSTNVDKWLEKLTDPQLWRLASDYLDALGPSVLEAMGYEYQAIRDQLDARRPGRLKLRFTFSMYLGMGNVNGRGQWWRTWYMHWNRYFQSLLERTG